MAGAITVSASSSRFKEPYYSKLAKCQLWVASNHTPTLLKSAMPLVGKLWQKGVEFKKAGVLLTHITEEGVIQLSLFKDYNPEQTQPCQLMLTLDTLNAHHSQDKVRFAVMGLDSDLAPCDLKLPSLLLQ